MARSVSTLLLGLGFGFGWTMNVQALTIVDDDDSALRYSNSGPAWIGGDLRTGGTPRGPFPVGPNIQAYGTSYHEAFGDGAWVQMIFTGTRILLNATIAQIGYTTRVGFYIDGNLVSTYTKELPARPLPSSTTDYDNQVTIFDQDGLAPAQHTFRAMTVGSDSLFLFDALEFEPSDAVPTSTTSSSSTGSTSINTTTNSSTGTSSLNSTLSSTGSTTNDSSSTNAANSAVNLGTSTIIATVTPNADSNIASSPSSIKSTTVIGAVVGSLAGVTLLILIGFFLLRRQRRKKEEELYDDAATTLPWNGSNNGTHGGSFGNGGFGGSTSHYGSETADTSEMSQRPFQVPLSQNHGTYPIPPRTGPIPAFLQRSNANADSTTIDGITTDTDTDMDVRTYQTLPSYHERVRESGNAFGRNLSQADINAISQRLTEMMRTHIQQSGNPQAPYALNELDQRVIVPPRELVDHLVEERLNGRGGNP